MSPSGATGFAQSVLTRLKNEARRRNRPFAELLELYAIERLLHRLGSSPHRDRFVLKGALLLRHWLGADTRPTRDIDLLGPIGLGEERLREFLNDLMSLSVAEDGIIFDPDSIAIRPVRAESTVLGLRARFGGQIGRTRLRYQVDVGLGDAVYPPTEQLAPGGLLGMPMSLVHAYTPYTTIAEKLEAMVVLGEATTRLKDYFDLFELPRVLSFDGLTLVEAIRRTFERRSRQVPAEPLEGLSDAFAASPIHSGQWRAFLGKNQVIGSDPDFGVVVASIRRFAQPAIDAVHDQRTLVKRWPPGGPWN